uniref:Uncharacterized protein n=1 Tax=Sphaerodactylus townsendi TaxID=933632 RepID=A0ACB8EM62_9SAUR
MRSVPVERGPASMALHKARSLPDIPELDVLSALDDEAFLPNDAAGPPVLAKPGSGSKSPGSPVSFPVRSPTYLTKLKINRSIQEVHRKARSLVSAAIW